MTVTAVLGLSSSVIGLEFAFATYPVVREEREATLTVASQRRTRRMQPMSKISIFPQNRTHNDLFGPSQHYFTLRL